MQEYMIIYGEDGDQDIIQANTVDEAVDQFVESESGNENDIHRIYEIKDVTLQRKSVAQGQVSDLPSSLLPAWWSRGVS